MPRRSRKPKWNHTWEVERRNCGTYSNRLAQHDFINTRGDIFTYFTFCNHWHTTGYFNILNHSHDLSFSFLESLSTFIGDRTSNFITIRF